MKLRPRRDIGTLPFDPKVYGHSHLGLPLEVWHPSSTCKILIHAGIHGEEGETTVALSRALRLLTEPSPHCAVVLAANPDGLVRGTRGNARGVDLNRNFPDPGLESRSRPAPVHPGRPQGCPPEPGHTRRVGGRDRGLDPPDRGARA